MSTRRPLSTAAILSVLCTTLLAACEGEIEHGDSTSMTGPELYLLDDDIRPDENVDDPDPDFPEPLRLDPLSPDALPSSLTWTIAMGVGGTLTLSVRYETQSVAPSSIRIVVTSFDELTDEPKTAEGIVDLTPTAETLPTFTTDVILAAGENVLTVESVDGDVVVAGLELTRPEVQP
jgi:hypothetical protein